MSSKITAESIKVYGMAKVPGSRDQVIKIEAKKFNDNVGLDVRGWYKPTEEKWAAMSDSDKAAADAKGYMPGKGLFMSMILAEWLVKKINDMGKDDTFLKLVMQAKEAAKLEESKNPADDKLSKENADLKARLAKMEEMMAALTKKAAPKTDELEEVALPESSTTNPTRPRTRRS